MTLLMKHSPNEKGILLVRQAISFLVLVATGLFRQSVIDVVPLAPGGSGRGRRFLSGNENFRNSKPQKGVYANSGSFSLPFFFTAPGSYRLRPSL
jgi:hypothetical protein